MSFHCASFFRLIPLLLSPIMRYIYYICPLFISFRFTKMKTRCIFPLFFLFPILLWAQSVAIQVRSASPSQTILSINVSNIQLQSIKGEEKKGLLVAKEASNLLRKGAPDVQKLSSALIIPATANMKIEVLSEDFYDIRDVRIAPSKGNLTRNMHPSEVPFVYGKEYAQDAFYPNAIAELQTPYILRDVRGQAVWIYPLRYNPVSKVLRVYKNIQLRIYADGENALNVLTRTLSPQKIDKEFSEVYQHQFLNYAKTATYTPVEENGSLLIICHPAFMATMQPFIAWKKQKGIATEIVDVSTIGAQATVIKSYIVQYYSTHPNLKYILLVGDNPQIPCMTYNGNPSDNAYSYLAGSDSYPEVFMGRFSAESVAQLQTQIDKTIAYEKLPSAATVGYNKGLCIASSEGPGDDNQMDYEHAHGLRNQLMAYNYTQVNELYDGTHTTAGYTDAPGNPVSFDVVDNIESGISVLNYTGHGSTTSLVTTNFNVTDAASLENEKMFPFIWTVGCVSGEFMNATCLAEACLRAQHPVTGKPTGAIAAMMSTINQSWDPPMDGQDEMNAILTENVAGNIKRSFGGISFNGCMKMNDTYGAQGEEMTDTWTLFGDPTVIVFTNTPTAMSVTHAATTPLGTTNFMVNGTEEGAFVSLTQNGEIIGTGNVLNGMVDILLIQPISAVNDITVTVTDYNNIPYIGTVQVTVPNSPYVGITLNNLDDFAGNNNQLADFTEIVQLDINAHNYGTQPATGVAAVLSSADAYLTITDANATLGNVAASAMISQNAAFEIQVANNVPDQHIAQLSAAITDANGGTWTSPLQITLNAPKLGVLDVQIQDNTGNNNGFIDSGETLTLVFHNQNTGHADAHTIGTLQVNNPLISLQNASVNVGTIAAGGGLADAVFILTADASMTKGTMIQFSYQLADGTYLADFTFSTLISPNVVNFEPNNTSGVTWLNSGNAHWFTTTNVPYEGVNCQESGDVANSQSSVMEFYYNVTQADSMSFYRKVSSEEDYDYLHFYIDNVEQNKWSGVLPWERMAYYLPIGAHSFKWVYEKDPYVSEGLDAAFVDFIMLPNGVAFVGINEQIADRNMDLYPNPTNQSFFIDCEWIPNENAYIQIFNTNGRLIKSLIPTSNHTNVSLDNLSKGIYFIKIGTGESVWTKKLIIVE
jgi:Peptidase family C25/Propeptide_C25/Secretion system C-terminal sorting domain/Peptidase family C25, C terminal ig-like domain